MARERELQGDTHQRLASLGQVAGELVHDLCNEVAVLQGWALLARGELEAGRTPSAEVERVVEISTGLGEMLRDVLGTLAGEGLSPEVTFDPVALTEETLSARIRELSGVTVHLRATLPAGVRVAGRASFWARTLRNLLSNAARHARREVAVVLRLEGEGTGAPQVVLRVEDDGSGLEPRARAASFEPFWRGSSGETGLGLSSARWAAAQLRGELGYRDDAQLGGAAFELRVPVAATPVARRAPRAGQLAGLMGARILLIDDDAAVRHALGRLLQRTGAEVRELDPRGEPEERVLHAVLAMLPDVVLLDLRLGDRGGVALWSRMRLEMPQLAVRTVFVSGAAPGETDREQAERTGQPVLAKPLDLEKLAEVVALLRGGG